MDRRETLRRSEEWKQSFARIRVSTTIFGLLVVLNLVRDGYLGRHLVSGLSVIFLHTIFSLAWHQLVKRKPGAWPRRIFVALVVDITATTLAFHFAARIGAFFYPVFLWVIVGYGLRYGKRTLFAAALLGFAEFGLVINNNAYWQENTLTGNGLWWGILILPAFFIAVLNRMSALNDELQVELQRSKAAEKAKGEFLANMSHEIRTPLNGVLGMAQILEDQQMDPGARQNLGILRRSANSLLDIVNDILDFSKIASGKMTLETAPFDLRVVLQDVVQILSSAAVAKGIILELRYPEQAPRGFVGDAVRLRQIVLNLAANAVKFTEVGGVVLSASVDGLADGVAQVTLRIRDTGVGVPADRLPHIFEQFEQVDSSTTRRFGGTGLGLAISRELTLRMGGDIRVESTVDVGSEFSVEIPLPTAVVAPVGPECGSALPAFALEVLVAEDNTVNQLVIRKLLRKVGIEAVIVGDGQQAIAELERRRFDLVFMDVRMPVMDGFEATRLIRARSDDLATIPIIALTADADSDSARRCVEAGMNLHLGKPVILAQAVAAIQSLDLPALAPVPR